MFTGSNSNSAKLSAGYTLRTLGVVNVPAVDLGIIPGLAFIAITINSICIAVLRRLGLKNSFNIFLLCLSIASIVLAINCVKFIGLLCNYLPVNNGSDSGFMSSGTFCHTYVLLVISLMQEVLYESAFTMLALLPLVASFERMAAVYKPLSIAHIVTPRRTTILCLLLSFFTTLCYSLIIYNEYEITNHLEKVDNETRCIAILSKTEKIWSIVVIRKYVWVVSHSVIFFLIISILFAKCML